MQPLFDPTRNAQRRDFSTPQLKLIRRTVARTCTDGEFDEFMAIASDAGLDPLRRQLVPLIVSPADPEKRRLVPWTTIDGLRLIAARQGDYGPMETAPVIERDDALTDPEKNPLGIARAEVLAWKIRDGDWHPIAGEAWWDEYSPLSQHWTTDEAGRSRPTGEVRLHDSWRRMGRVMICKCAEAQALRRGWPDVLSGLYGEEELHRLRLTEQLASEILRSAHYAKSSSRELRTLWFVMNPGGPLEPVPLHQVFNTLQSVYAAHTSEQLTAFEKANRASLQTYWEWAPGDAFALKMAAEAQRTTFPVTTTAPPASVTHDEIKGRTHTKRTP